MGVLSEDLSVDFKAGLGDAHVVVTLALESRARKRLGGRVGHLISGVYPGEGHDAVCDTLANPVDFVVPVLDAISTGLVERRTYERLVVLLQHRGVGLFVTHVGLETAHEDDVADDFVRGEALGMRRGCGDHVLAFRAPGDGCVGVVDVISGGGLPIVKLGTVVREPVGVDGAVHRHATAAVGEGQ